ncbi:MAG: helix-turn-helix transcriptional regulator [Clostridiales bacterium]|nr:helix-turn-helix transcriptional regulator [Clostridiales bacterium]
MNKKHYEKYRYLGLKIAYYRKLNGYTQEELAEKLSLDRTTISKIELAVSGVSVDVIFDISELLCIPASKLFEY